eukprot:TRINITY_DN3288_c0_g1_i1.p1 TRINITY_DN3288_c0_g1~~TRINITY_DN3288_c0_g1_i1.p1  ORF type:complete len:592 (-),score=254.54 TRINITY_DN3288_c0_g1_i1:384-2159(-)
MADTEKRHTVQLTSSEKIERRKAEETEEAARKRAATGEEAVQKSKSGKASSRSKEERKSARKSKSKSRPNVAGREGVEDSSDGSESEGPTTPKGEKGPRSPKGEKGPMSPKGDKGDKREKGEKGEKSDRSEKKEKRKRSKSSKKEGGGLGRSAGSPRASCESSPSLCSSAPISSGHFAPVPNKMRRSADDQEVRKEKAVSVAQRQMRKARGGKRQRPLSMLYQGALLMAVEDFEGTGPDELVFQKGDMIMFIEKDENGWVRGECNDRSGWFPRKHVQLLPGSKDSKLFDDEQHAGTRGSIIEKKAETKSKLGKFLTLRPSPQHLQERGTILAEDGKAEASAGDKVDKKKKREYLKRFMSVRGLRQKPTDSAAKVFGASLEELEAGSSSPIPVIVQQCVAYLQAHDCAEVEGIFRKSGNNNTLTLIKEKYRTPSDEPDLESMCEDPHIIAVLLKQFLGSMSDPVVPASLYDDFIAAFQAEEEEKRLEQIRAMVMKLPHRSSVVLHYLIEFLVPIAANNEVNLMTGSNLGVVFGPNVFRPLVQTQMTLMDSTSASIIEFLIDHEDEVFAGLPHAEDAQAEAGEEEEPAAPPPS